MRDPVTPFPKFGAGIGLHRVGAIAADLGLDLAGFGARACVITGSNGKGSVAAMTAAILSAARPNVGLFTSPHLFSIRERFAIDGEAIAPDELEAHWARVLAAVRAYEARHPGDAVGGFEFLFLIAASWFAARGCAFTVWEAGIGGRYDPVRLVRAPRAALVSLDLEHTKLLGDTLELIACDKADACAPGGDLHCGETALPLAARLRAYCALQGVRPRFLAEGQGWRVCADGRVAIEAAMGEIVAAPPLAGPHQRNNTVLAVTLACAALAAAGVSESAARAAIAAGLARVRWPGRLETIAEAPPIVIDVGHTPDAIRRAREGFLALHAPGVLVCGCSTDKDAEGVIAALAPGFPVIVCAAARHKGAPAPAIAAIARAANPSAEIVIAGALADARAAALERAAARGAAIYVAGGLFLAAEFKALHLGLDPAHLAFF